MRTDRLLSTGERATRTCRNLAVLVLVSLALSQLALAAHQFDHPAYVAFDHCGICAQLDRCDDVVADVATSTIEIVSVVIRPMVRIDASPASQVLPVRQRGPPLA